jgi:two-component sensor histidine kinase
MIERQRILAKFGEFALRSDELQEVLTEACRLVGQALGTDLAKIIEIQQDEQCLLVRAGVGWQLGIVGQMRLPMGERSSESYAIEVGEPVITQDIDKEERFAFPDFMKEHGIVALVNVPIVVPGGQAYGLLQVDSLKPRTFDEEDIEFLRTYATILGPVIDRLHKVHDLQVALDTNQRLLHELQHRIKNNIAIIASLVRMRVRQTTSEEARTELQTLGERIDTLRLIHEQLYAARATDRLQLRPYLTKLAESLKNLHQGESGKVKLEVEIDEIEVVPETALPLGLILNEFVTNSLKYAFDNNEGLITVQLQTLEDRRCHVRFADNGRGLPAEPRPSAGGSGAGMKLIEGLVRQLDGKASWSSSGGTTLCLEFTAR